MKRTLILILFIASFVTSLTAFSQEEKKYIRMGNKHFEKEQYTESEVDYLRALSVDSTSQSAAYNLASTLYRQERYADAQKLLQGVIERDSLKKVSSDASFNLANSLLKERKLEEAIEAYKGSLRINPTDTLAKKNLAYAQALLKKDQNKDDQNKDQNKDDQNKDQNKDDQNKDDQNKDQNKDDQNKDQNKDDQNKDQNKDDQNKDQNKDDQNKDDQNDKQDGQNQPQNGEMSKEDAQKLLDAMQKSEDKTQEKVGDKKAVGVVGRSGKNW